MNQHDTPDDVVGQLRRPAVFVFGFALLVRLVHLWQIRAAPFFPLRMGDARTYDEWARRIVGGEWLGDQVFYQAPLYPYFLAFVYAALGDDVLMVRGCQALIGAASCMFLAAAGARLFSLRTGVVAGVLLAVYAPAIFFDLLIQKSVLDIFFLSLLLWILGGLGDTLRGRSALAAGIVLGCLILVRENAMLFVVAILIWLVATHRKAPARLPTFILLFAAGLSGVLLPVAARNYHVGGEFHLTTSQLGTMLYVGNNEFTDGMYVPLDRERDTPLFEREDATRLAEAALERQLTPAEVSRYWTGRALDYVREHPIDWAFLTLRKLALFWNATEVIDTEDQYSHAEWSAGLRLAGRLFHFGTIAPLAVMGLVLGWRRMRREHWLLLLLLGAYLASVLPFVVFARYRYPMVPLVILFAADGLVQLAGLIRRRSLPRASAGIAVAVAAAVLCNWPLINVVEMRAMTTFNIGSGLESRGETQSAIEHYRRALALDPDLAEAHLNLGSLLMDSAVGADSADGDDALTHFTEALRLRPSSARAHYNVAVVLASRGQTRQAADHYIQSLRADPDNAMAHNNLANLLQSVGSIDGAILHYREALRLDPDSLSAHFNLAITLGRAGRTSEAATHLEQTLRIDPAHRTARELLARIRAGSGGDSEEP